VSEQRQHIDDLLRDKFLSFEGDIPMSDWSTIEDKLNKKRRFAWLWWAAIPLLLIGSISFYTFINHYQPISLTLHTKEQLKQDLSSKNQTIENSATNSSQINNNSDIQNSNIDASHPLKSKAGHSQEISKSQTTNSDNPNSTNSNLPLPLISEISSYINLIDNIEMALKPVHFNKLIESNQTEMAGWLNLERPRNPKKLNLSFEFGLNISPAMGIDAIKDNRSKMIHRSYFSSIAGSSSLGNGFNNGLNAQVNLNKNWFLRSGLYSCNYSVYHNFNYSISEGPAINNKNDVIIGYFPIPTENISYNGKSSIKYLSLPVQFGNRTYFSKVFGLESKLGFNFSHLLSASGQSVNPTFLNLESINSNNSIRKWNSGVTISTGLFYKTKNNLIFTVEPNFSALLGSTKSKNYPVKTSYYNYGINLNINYVLKGGKK